MTEQQSTRTVAAHMRQSVQKAESAFPENVRRLVRGNIVDLSGASSFFRKRAEAATSLKGYVEPLRNFHYRLKNGFNSYYLLNLDHFHKGNDLELADALAEGLYQLGRQWAKIDYGNLPVASIPPDEFLRAEWKEADDWGAFVVRDACIGEAW